MKLITLLLVLILRPSHQSETQINPSTKTILFLLGTDTFGTPYWTNEFIHALNHRGYKLYVVTSILFDAAQLPGVEFIHLQRRHLTMPAVEDISFYSRIQQTTLWYVLQGNTCHGILQSPGIKDLVKLSKRISHKVDLIFFDASHGPSCLLAFAQLFPKAPIVGLSAIPASFDVFPVAGKSLIPFNVPYFTTGYGINMTFSERADNALTYGWAYSRRRSSWNHQKLLLTKLVETGVFRDATTKFIPDWEEQLKRVKVVFVNSHISMDHLQLLPPNVIEVGGIQFGVTQRHLEDDIREFMDNSRNGFFLISQGQIDDVVMLGVERQDSILKAVLDLQDYDFIWMLGTKNLPRGKAEKNLFILDILSDNEILTHPKAKGFITDGSHQSLQAAVYFGLPVIIIPIKIHHITNAARAVALGYAIKLKLKTFKADDLKKAVDTIINTNRYTRVAKRRQTMFRNRPHKPMDVAEWWIENLIKNPSQTDYFSSPQASKLSYIEEQNWDVEAFYVTLALSNILLLADTVGLLRVLCRWFRRVKFYVQKFWLMVYAILLMWWEFIKVNVFRMRRPVARAVAVPVTPPIPSARRVANRPKQKSKKRR